MSVSGFLLLVLLKQATRQLSLPRARNFRFGAKPVFSIVAVFPLELIGALGDSLLKMGFGWAPIVVAFFV